MADEIGDQLATLILQKECQLEMIMMGKKPQKEKLKQIKTLVATYSQAIEYYQSIDSEFYIDLNLRMQQLLTKPDILELLDKEAEINSQSISPTREISQTEVLPKPMNSKVISPKKIDADLKGFGKDDNRILESPKTRDSSMAFDTLFDQNLDAGDNYDTEGTRATFCVKDINALDGESTNTDVAKVPSKINAKFKVEEDHSNEFVYHRGDRRNRHGVSFKVCRNREDGALLRPKLPRTHDKKEIHSKMLNENNDGLESKPRVYATKEVLDAYQNQEDVGANLHVIERNMHEQESALKIRLLKRQNIMYKKRKGTDSSILDRSGFSTSPIKSHFSGEISFESNLFM